MLADAGVPLGAQTVLLKGVNDDPEVMKRLMHQLCWRVKPYYLYQADLTKGTNHFRTSVETGLKNHQVVARSHQRDGGASLCDRCPRRRRENSPSPGDYPVNLDEDGAVLRNYENNTYHYPQPGSPQGRELPMVGAHPPGPHPATGVTEG